MMRTLATKAIAKSEADVCISYHKTPTSKPLRHYLQSIAVLTVVVLCACTPQKQPSKLQLNAEQYCREQGFRQGTNDFENCVETTKQEILAQVRGSYQRLIRGTDR